MSKWPNNWTYFSRFLGSGAFNTIIGFSVIFLLTAIGISPFAANIAGYSIGFLSGYVINKKYVFQSNENILGESMRYLVAFIFCFMLNLLVLKMAIDEFYINALTAQIVSATFYTLSMYMILQLYVFKPKYKIIRSRRKNE